jgi:hypothetical protein
MLIGTLGVRLILWMGKTVPRPAPFEVTQSLTELTVTNDADGTDGFQFTLTLGKSTFLDYAVMSSGALDPMTRVLVGVLMGATPEVLIDGVITHHQLAPSNEPGGSTLTVTGKDLTQVMDLEERNDKFENQPDFVIAARLISAYARYGLIPFTTPTTDIPIMLQRIPRQHETDLAFIRRMAERNGYVFYVEPITFGLNKAYFGPETRVSLPQKALTMNMGASTNVTSLSFTHDALAPVGTRGVFVEPFLKLPIPIPELPSLRLPPLVSKPAPAERKVQLRNTANENPARAATAAVAAVSRSPEAVRGNGTLDAARYGKVLRARRLVGVRGVGTSYDGFYYVRRVTHSITRGTYTQQFSLSREGTGTLTPVVVP